MLSPELRKAIRAGGVITIASVFFTFVPVWIWLQIDPVIDTASVYTSCIIIPLIIAPCSSWFLLRAQMRAERLAQENHRLANEDELTGLPNRRAFFARASVLQMQADADAGAGQFYCAIADVDDFKRVNDTYGHETGDAVLVSVGRALGDLVPATGVIARLGGEEFALAGLFGSEAEARLAAALLVGAVAGADYGALGLARPVTISMGLCCETGQENLSTLLSRADEALYWAKQAGKNRVMVYEDGPVPPLARVG
ncbi:MAG: GGDEF domain-containing protein [Alphaproteobacteria bacterium HGW-Alphaproteobacteria-18]|nr:MAG: GGDEF domain-containing protein [Alphaproteobacteria bacterium HGW-Alphaproteobacteria-18]